MINKTNTPWIITSIFLVIIMFMATCNCHKCPVCPEVKTHIDTIIGDSIPYSVIKDRPYPVFRDTGRVRWRYMDVDTTAILLDYYTLNVYQDTLKNDTSALIVVCDSVWMNQLSKRLVTFQNRRVTTIINNSITPTEKIRNKVFVGPTFGISNKSVSVGASILYQTKNDHLYSYTYDIRNKSHYLTWYLKLQLKH